MEHIEYLIAAYLVLWAGLFLYTLRLSGKNAELLKNIRILVDYWESKVSESPPKKA